MIIFVHTAYAKTLLTFSSFNLRSSPLSDFGSIVFVTNCLTFFETHLLLICRAFLAALVCRTGLRDRRLCLGYVFLLILFGLSVPLMGNQLASCGFLGRKT